MINVYVVTCNSKIIESGTLLTAEKWQSYKLCSSYERPCVQLLVSTVEEEKNQKAENWWSGSGGLL